MHGDCEIDEQLKLQAGLDLLGLEGFEAAFVIHHEHVPFALVYAEIYAVDPPVQVNVFIEPKVFAPFGAETDFDVHRVKHACLQLPIQERCRPARCTAERLHLEHGRVAVQYVGPEFSLERFVEDFFHMLCRFLFAAILDALGFHEQFHTFVQQRSAIEGINGECALLLRTQPLFHEMGEGTGRVFFKARDTGASVVQLSCDLPVQRLTSVGIERRAPQMRQRSASFHEPERCDRRRVFFEVCKVGGDAVECADGRGQTQNVCAFIAFHAAFDPEACQQTFELAYDRAAHQGAAVHRAGGETHAHAFACLTERVLQVHAVGAREIDRAWCEVFSCLAAEQGKFRFFEYAGPFRPVYRDGVHQEHRLYGSKTAALRACDLYRVRRLGQYLDYSRVQRASDQVAECAKGQRFRSQQLVHLVEGVKQEIAHPDRVLRQRRFTRCLERVHIICVPLKAPAAFKINAEVGHLFAERMRGAQFLAQRRDLLCQLLTYGFGSLYHLKATAREGLKHCRRSELQPFAVVREDFLFFRRQAAKTRLAQRAYRLRGAADKCQRFEQVSAKGMGACAHGSLCEIRDSVFRECAGDAVFAAFERLGDHDDVAVGVSPRPYELPDARGNVSRFVERVFELCSGDITVGLSFLRVRDIESTHHLLKRR